ncbi:MAG: hypothetical protein Tsb0021_06530 [Chlamydiales bacterium]
MIQRKGNQSHCDINYFKNREKDSFFTTIVKKLIKLLSSFLTRTSVSNLEVHTFTDARESLKDMKNFIKRIRKEILKDIPQNFHYHAEYLFDPWIDEIEEFQKEIDQESRPIDPAREAKIIKETERMIRNFNAQKINKNTMYQLLVEQMKQDAKIEVQKAHALLRTIEDSVDFSQVYQNKMVALNKLEEFIEKITNVHDATDLLAKIKEEKKSLEMFFSSRKTGPSYIGEENYQETKWDVDQQYSDDLEEKGFIREHIKGNCLFCSVLKWLQQNHNYPGTSPDDVRKEVIQFIRDHKQVFAEDISIQILSDFNKIREFQNESEFDETMYIYPDRCEIKQLYRKIFEYYQKLRQSEDKDEKQAIQTKIDQMEATLLRDPFETYIDAMSLSDTYGGPVELKAMSMVFNASIHLYSGRYKYPMAIGDQNKDPNDIIHILIAAKKRSYDLLYPPILTQ